MSDCEGEIDPRARQGILLFNQGRYFEAHEELEMAWIKERGLIRRLYQGILEAGVTYLHLRRHNLAGAVKVYERSMRWLTEWPEVCRRVHVGKLRRDLHAVIAEARKLGPVRVIHLDASFFRPIILDED